jgi:hypothetical protein
MKNESSNNFSPVKTKLLRSIFVHGNIGLMLAVFVGITIGNMSFSILIGFIGGILLGVIVVIIFPDRMEKKPIDNFNYRRKMRLAILLFFLAIIAGIVFITVRMN